MSLVDRLFRRRGLGWLEDVPDARDKPLDALLGALASSAPPASASVRSLFVVPKDQGGTSSCTGMAWPQAVRTDLLHRGVDCPELSGLFNYYAGRAETGRQKIDRGSTLRAAAKAIIRFGCAAESAWPFVAARVNKQPTFAAFRSAHDLRGLKGYFQIDGGDANSVRRTIAAGHPVVGGWDIDRAFQQADGSKVIEATSGAIIGGHAIMLESYEADGTFEILNSWGRSWAKEGRARVSESFISQGRNFWAVAT